METSNFQLLGLVPPLAAPALLDYLQFTECTVPTGSGAIRAFKGFIRPFCDDNTAKHVLRAIESNRTLQIVGGRLSCDASDLSRHPAEEFLIHMAVPCTVLILEFSGSEHRRAFLLNPKLSPRISLNPHYRFDKSIHIDGEIFPALCAYSGNLFTYTDETDHLVQFLDQIATYLAKHLIWLRTRILVRRNSNGSQQIIRRRRPSEPVTYIELLLANDLHWDGYWAGLWAPSGADQHLKTVDPNGECWCWSGKLYKYCHQKSDRKLMNIRSTVADTVSRPLPNSVKPHAPSKSSKTPINTSDKSFQNLA
jgi:hypothetical protein